MRTVLPGKPQARLQAVSTAEWKDLRVVVYISGNGLVILTGPHQLIQTIYQDDQSPLDAVSIDRSTGKIVTCSSNEVTVYSPYGKEEGLLKWVFQSSFEWTDVGQDPPTLSWGSEGELLLGSSSLRLYRTAEDNALIWSCNLPRPVKTADFSYDSSLVASTSIHDRLIKLWRRQSFGSGDTRFDFTYLPHPTVVTAIHWRKANRHEHNEDNVLFSICADSKIRIWAATDPHGLQTLQLWAEIDMQESLQPRDLELSAESKERYAFIIDSKDFALAAGQAKAFVGDKDGEANHALEHLLEISKANPDVCVVLDRHGNMSAWGLENVGCKARKNTDIFNIAHVERVQFPFLQDVSSDHSLGFLNFSNQHSGAPFTLLVHHFDGRIFWLETTLEELFDPSQSQERVHVEGIWTGHSSPITMLSRSADGEALLSCSDNGNGVVWKRSKHGPSMTLSRASSLDPPTPFDLLCLLEHGDFILGMHDCEITLWDARSKTAEMVASHRHNSRGHALCLTSLLKLTADPQSYLVASLTSNAEVYVWRVGLSAPLHLDSDGNITQGIIKLSSSHLPISGHLAIATPAEPQPREATVSTETNSLANDVFISFTDTGLLESWNAVVNLEERRVDWKVAASIKTGIPNASIVRWNSGKIAIVDQAKTNLTIWDQKSGQQEFDAQYESPDGIQGLSMFTTSTGFLFLTVQFSYETIVLGQMRYDYSSFDSAWATITEINIKDTTSNPISGSAWLEDELVIGTGNQLYTYDRDVELSDHVITKLAAPLQRRQSFNAFSLVEYLNSHLLIYHHDFLTQCMLSREFTITHDIIIALHKALKFFVPGDELDVSQHMRLDTLYAGKEVCLLIESKTTCPDHSRKSLASQRRYRNSPLRIQMMMTLKSTI